MNSKTVKVKKTYTKEEIDELRNTSKKNKQANKVLYNSEDLESF